MNENNLFLKINPKHILFFKNVFEGYDGLGLVTTVKGKEGIIKINITLQTRSEVFEILANFSLPLEIIDYKQF